MLKMFSSLDERKASGPITPVPQSGDKDDVSNYWPVSVIPVLAKIFESLVHHQLYHYLETNSLLNDAQLGLDLIGAPKMCYIELLMTGRLLLIKERLLEQL